MVYWNNQEIIASAIGGVLIAISTTLNLLLYGRITGLSGAFSSIIKYDKPNGFEWKTAFFVGLITIPAVLNQIYGNKIDGFEFVMFDDNAPINQKQNIAAWIIGGLLVGWGTKMGNGCTSGHGVCGLPRLAPRSIVATMTFMGTGFAIATLRYYVPFLTGGPDFGLDYAPAWRWVALGVLIAANIVALIIILQGAGKRVELVISYIIGLIFGLGLVIAGMCRISKIQNFLIIGDVWDPSLAFVMFSAVAINLVTFNYILKKVEKPILAGENGKYGVPPRGVIDARLVIGAALFGLGWGLGGLCPGPGVICFFSMTHAIIWVASLAIGMVAFDYGLSLYENLTAKQPPSGKAIIAPYNTMNEEGDQEKPIGQNLPPQNQFAGDAPSSAPTYRPESNQ